MKKLLLDFVYLPEVCNFRCRYCTSRKRGTSVGHAETARLIRNLHDALDAIADRFLIYRFSGGEIFLAEEVISWILDQPFPIVQLLTNGTHLSAPLLARFQQARERLWVVVSLDGHTPDMNRMRQSRDGMEPGTLAEILAHLNRLVGAGIPVEIQTVISEANCESLPRFLDFLLDRFPTENLMVSPFPMRPMEALLRLGPLQEIVTNYHRYRTLLPSQDYMAALVDSLSRGRTERCRVPELFRFQVLERGQSSSPRTAPYFCECGGLKHYYGPECRTCFTHYDLYNSILAGRSAVDAIPFPPFRNVSLRGCLQEQSGKRPGRGFPGWMAYGKARVLGNRYP